MASVLKRTDPLLWLAPILLLALFLRWYFFVGLNWADDPWYVNEANEVLKGHFHPENNLNRRIATYLPIAFSFYLFGIDEFSAVLFSLLCSLAEIVLIFLIAKRFLNEQIGLLAALILAIYPLHVNYATMAMGDVPVSLFGALSVFLFLLAREKAWGEYGDSRDRRRMWFLFFCAGFIAYVSYLIKELGLLAPLFMFVCFTYDIIKKRALNFHYACVLVGFLAAFFFEAGVYYLMGTIDPFVSINQGIEFFSDKENLRFLSFNMTYYPHYMFDPDLIFNLGPHKHQDFFYYNYFSFFFYLVGISIIFLLLKGEKNTYKFIFWLLVILLWMQFGTMSWSGYIPLHRLVRHLTIITIPSILLFSAALYGFISPGGAAAQPSGTARWFLSGAVVLMLTVFWFANLGGTTRYLVGKTQDIRAIHESIKNIDKPIYTSEHAAAYLRFLSGYKKDNIRVIPDFNCTKTRDSYVVTNAELGWILFEPYIKSLPSCILAPPEHWLLIKTIDTAFREPPYNRFDPKIYYVP